MHTTSTHEAGRVMFPPRKTHFAARARVCVCALAVSLSMFVCEAREKRQIIIV